jgi:hypothetical protein
MLTDLFPSCASLSFQQTDNKTTFGKRFFVIRLPRRHHPGFVAHDPPDLSLVGKAGSVERQMKNLKAFLRISGRILVIGAIEAIDRVINQAKLRRNHAALPDSKNTSPSRKEISA